MFTAPHPVIEERSNAVDMDPANDIASWFNPNAALSTVSLGRAGTCHVIDQALLEPDRLVDWVIARRDAFEVVDFNAYPGIHLASPEGLANALQAVFQRYLQRHFDAQRLLEMQSRFSMVTRQPEALRPIQWLCHSDKVNLDPGLSIQAALLYLFEDPALGGTSFYMPRAGAEKMDRLYRDASAMTAREFSDTHGIQPGFMDGDNEYFERIGTIEARWNRMIFYDASILHSGDIPHPQRLSTDPARGRLTYNGFFTSLRHAARG